tara:strand:- start:239 stop:1249 length:1011 start_codon:yes stop_codon:yes gene_type:complete
MFKNKTILVTGGTGSFGKALVAEIIKKYPNFKKLIIFSRDELKQFEMLQDKIYQHKNVRMILGDIRDFRSIKRALQEVDIIIHAAALKQVPTAEYNPFQFIQTNVIGSQNVIEAALDTNVSQVVALSTDKASSPINLYGATKLCLEKLFTSANNVKGKKKINFSVVRYGNVIGSRGSVIPFFINNHKKGNKLTVTDTRMTRFNINLSESIELVIKSLKFSKEGEIFIPKIPSFKIIDLVKAITNEKKFKITGIRPGEKLHEELISVYEGYSSVEFKNHYAILATNDKTKILSYCKKNNAKRVASGFCYTSDKNPIFLDVNNLKKIIKKELPDMFNA